MFKIIAGLDDSEEARDALALARELADIEHAEVIAAAAFLFTGEHLKLAYPEAKKAFVATTRKRAEIAFEGIRHRYEELFDSPAHGLHRLAEEERADVIVIGSTRRGAVGRVLPGSVGELLFAAAPCPIAVAPRGYATDARRRLERVGVGYDGSAESDLALSEAIGIAKRSRAKLEVITVAPDFDPMYEGPAEALRDRYHGHLAGALERARDEWNEVGGTLSDSDAAEALLSHCGEIDLLVLGSRGYGPLRHVLLGSTSARVVRGAPCPVMVVPRGAKRTVREHAAEIEREQTHA